MSRRAARFAQADVARALKAIKQAGVASAVEIATDGTMRIVPIDPKSTPEQVRRLGALIARGITPAAR